MIATKYDKLTTEKKEAAVGLAAGWTLDKGGWWISPNGVSKPLPLFTSDLTAVNAIERSLTPKQFEGYFSVLVGLCAPSDKARAICAAADLRCKALVLNSIKVKKKVPAKKAAVKKTKAEAKRKILRRTDMITEHCEGCDKDVKIPAYGITGCPKCKQHIRPCSLCDLDTQPCNYDEETGACFVYRRGFRS